jgi:hypothetical protein
MRPSARRHRALYKSVLGLPAATRKIALRGLFQGEAQ